MVRQSPPWPHLHTHIHWLVFKDETFRKIKWKWGHWCSEPLAFLVIFLLVSMAIFFASPWSLQHFICSLLKRRALNLAARCPLYFYQSVGPFACKLGFTQPVAFCPFIVLLWRSQLAVCTPFTEGLPLKENRLCALPVIYNSVFIEWSLGWQTAGHFNRISLRNFAYFSFSCYHWNIFAQTWWSQSVNIIIIFFF